MKTHIFRRVFVSTSTPCPVRRHLRAQRSAAAAGLAAALAGATGGAGALRGVRVSTAAARGGVGVRCLVVGWKDRGGDGDGVEHLFGGEMVMKVGLATIDYRMFDPNIWSIIGCEC